MLPTHDPWQIGGVTLTSRLLLGTSRYPSLKTLHQAILKSRAQVVTVSLRREIAAGSGLKTASKGSSLDRSRFWQVLKDLPVHILPNTAGCFTAQEAILTAELASDLFETHWIKLEVIENDITLAPEPRGLLKAAEQLINKGFTIFPYTKDDPHLCGELIDLGCSILMPWGAPIGTGQGLAHPQRLREIRERWPEISLIVDAGLGHPSHAAAAMELGYEGVLLNTAIATAQDPVLMAEAFAQAVEAGRHGYRAGLMTPRPDPVPSTPFAGRAHFLTQET